MKILVIGGSSGTVGKCVAKCFQEKHEVLTAGRTHGDVQVNIEDAASIRKMYEQTGTLDAVICCAGATKWAPFDAMSEDDYFVGIRSKLMGQVNLVRIGQNYLSEGGSFTLTTGILADDPVLGALNSAMVNNAIHGFVLAVSQELKNGIRINAVAPGLVEDSAERLGDAFPGHTPVAMNKVAAGYVRSVEGLRSGEIIRVYS